MKRDARSRRRSGKRSRGEILDAAHGEIVDEEAFS